MRVSKTHRLTCRKCGLDHDPGSTPLAGGQRLTCSRCREPLPAVDPPAQPAVTEDLILQWLSEPEEEVHTSRAPARRQPPGE